MFIRIFKQKNKNGTVREYLALVESLYVDGKKKQKTIGYLGRLDEIIEDGTIDRLVSNLDKFTNKVQVIMANKDISKSNDFILGAKLCVESLLHDIGILNIINNIIRNRKHEFDVKKSLIDIILNRLIDPLSKRGLYNWQMNINTTECEKTELHHYYRTLDFLFPYIEEIEDKIFNLRPFDLFNQKVNVVFYDTTSVKYYGAKQEGFLEHGFSKDKRPDLVQLVIGLLVDSNGIPIAHKIFAGNTQDVSTVKPVLNEFKRRFKIDKVIFIGDRGMSSKTNLEFIENELGLEYIIGSRMKSKKEVRREVLSRGGRYKKVSDNLEVKEVNFRKKRYIVCYNKNEAIQDNKKREHIVSQLQKLEGRSIKELVGNRGYKAYLFSGSDKIKLDTKKIEEEKRYDGKWVLRTNTTLPPEEVALYYKTLVSVEQNFHNLKGNLEIAPLYHWNPECIKSHVFISYLSLLVWRTFIERLRQVDGSTLVIDVWWSLCNIRGTEINLKDKKYIIRNETDELGKLGFKVCRAKLPNIVQEVMK